MVSLAEQTENTFGPKPIEIPQMGLEAPLPDPYSPEIKKLRKQIFTEDLPKALPRVAKGVAVGIPAIPSDIIELNKLVNDLAIRYGSKNISTIAQSVQPQVDFLQKKFGRDKFDNMLNSIGISSDASDPAQMIGEIVSGFITGGTLVKMLEKLGSKAAKKTGTNITVPTKQTAVSTDVAKVGLKDPSKRTFLKSMGAVAMSPVALKASALIPKGNIVTNIEKSYQALTPLVQNFRVSNINFDTNLTRYFYGFNKAQSVGSYSDIIPATDKDGKPIPNLFTMETGKQPVNLDKQHENIIKNRELLKLETEKHLKLLHGEKRKISFAARIPENDIHVVKSTTTTDQLEIGPKNKEYHFDQDIRLVDSLNNTHDIFNASSGQKPSSTTKNAFYDSPLSGSVKKIKNQAFILPNGTVVDTISRLKAMRESIDVSKKRIGSDFSLILNELPRAITDTRIKESPIIGEALTGKLTANDIKSWELNTGETFPYKDFHIFFNRVFKNVTSFGRPLDQMISKQRVNDTTTGTFNNIESIKKELDILNFMYSLSNKSKAMGLQSYGDNPLFNNLTNEQVLFIRDFYRGEQGVLRKRYAGVDNISSFSIPDILNTKIRRTLKPLRADVADGILNKHIKNLKGKELDDELLEYSGTSLYRNTERSMPTREETTEGFHRLRTDHYFNKITNQLDSLISVPEKNSKSVFRSLKRLNSLLELFNGGFQKSVPDNFPELGNPFEKASSSKIRDIEDALEAHLYRLVKHANVPLDKARDIVNTEFKNSLLSAYYDRMNIASVKPNDLANLKELAKEFKKLDTIYPTTNSQNQVYTKFLKANIQIPKNLAELTDVDQRFHDGYIFSGREGITELDQLSMPNEILKNINQTSKMLESGVKKIEQKTDDTTRLLKGVDSVIEGGKEAPKAKYTKNVYHLGKGEIKGDKFNLMGESDFGIHVGTKGQAESLNKMRHGVIEQTNKPTLEFEGKEYKALGQRTFPLKIADDLKPARIPDIESFKMPNKWLDHLAVASDDKAGMDYMTQTTEAKLDLKNRPKVEYKGVTYYMSDIAAEMDVKNYDQKLNQSMVTEKMDEQLWKDLVLSALEEQTRRKKNKSLDFKERQVWFNKIKEVANKNGYDSFIYKNDKEQDQLDMWADSYMLLEQDQVKYKSSKTKTKGDPRLDKHKGGMI